jgi:signal transduction histidine kinase
MLIPDSPRTPRGRRSPELLARALSREQDARARAERASRMRDDVLAVVAHDLRNPLHTLQLSAQAMAEPNMTVPMRQRQVRLITRLVESMNRLIDELLDIGRIEAGSFPVSKAPIRLKSVLDDTVSTFAPQARERGISLTREDVSPLGIVVCDRDQVMRVLWNLVGNAVKFTPPSGRVTLIAGRDHDMVEISVTDTGPGLSEEDLALVFERFWQADRTRRFGTGLGLVIAKGIVEGHGGSIWAESTMGHGSAFHVSLPAC